MNSVASITSMRSAYYFLEDVGFLKPDLIADGKFNEAYSFLFVPENQVRAEISMDDVRGKGMAGS